MFRSASSTVPVAPDSRPEAMRSTVDFPQPDGPTIVTKSPRRTSKETSRSASVPSGKVIETPSKRRLSGLDRPSVGGEAPDEAPGEEGESTGEDMPPGSLPYHLERTHVGM